MYAAISRCLLLPLGSDSVRCVSAVGSTHLKDNSNNTFIGLRILNASHNLAFFEFTDAVRDWNWTSTNFCEMYDLKTDPHQLHNICGAASASVKAELHQQLRQEYACKGAGCK